MILNQRYMRDFAQTNPMELETSLLVHRDTTHNIYVYCFDRDKRGFFKLQVQERCQFCGHPR